MNRRIPIIADDYVDKDFGTGAVKDNARPTTPTTLKSVKGTISQPSG